MKFNCGPTYEVKVEQQKNWHPFFAILPRRVGPDECRWLEWIERRREWRARYSVSVGLGYWRTEYRAKP